MRGVRCSAGALLCLAFLLLTTFIVCVCVCVCVRAHAWAADEGPMTEMLWSDPGPNMGLVPSKRGVGLSLPHSPSLSRAFLSPLSTSFLHISTHVGICAQAFLCALRLLLCALRLLGVSAAPPWCASCVVFGAGWQGLTGCLLAGVAFGADVTERFLKDNGLELLIRCVVLLRVSACIQMHVLCVCV